MKKLKNIISYLLRSSIVSKLLTKLFTVVLQKYIILVHQKKKIPEIGDDIKTASSLTVCFGDFTLVYLEVPVHKSSNHSVITLDFPQVAEYIEKYYFMDKLLSDFGIGFRVIADKLIVQTGSQKVEYEDVPIVVVMLSPKDIIRPHSAAIGKETIKKRLLVNPRKVEEGLDYIKKGLDVFLYQTSYSCPSKRNVFQKI